MSIFENIIFLNEARTKEEYLAQKQKEKEETEKADREHFEKRYGRDINNTISPSGMGGANTVGNKYKTAEYLVNGKNNMSPEYFKKGANDDFRRGKIDDEAKKKAEAIKIDKDLRYVTKKDIEEHRDKFRKSNILQTADAKNRHMRRHPEQYEESTIFGSLNFI